MGENGRSKRAFEEEKIDEDYYYFFKYIYIYLKK
jgi:hypothetical protein